MKKIEVSETDRAQALEEFGYLSPIPSGISAEERLALSAENLDRYLSREFPETEFAVFAEPSAVHSEVSVEWLRKTRSDPCRERVGRVIDRFHVDDRPGASARSPEEAAFQELFGGFFLVALEPQWDIDSLDLPPRPKRRSP